MVLQMTACTQSRKLVLLLGAALVCYLVSSLVLSMGMVSDLIPGSGLSGRSNVYQDNVPPPVWPGPRAVGPEDMVFFHHLRKTGGTSLSLTLRQMYGGAAAVLPGSDPSEILRKTQVDSAFNHSDRCATLSQQKCQKDAACSINPAGKGCTPAPTTGTDVGWGGGWHIRAGFSHSSVQAFMHYYKTKMTMPGAAQFGTFVYAQPPVYRYGSRGTLLATGTTPMPPTAKRPTRLHLLGLVREPAGVAISNWAESRCNVKGLISHGNFQDNATHGGDGGDVDSDDGCAFDLPAVGRARVKELILAGRCRTHLSCNLWGTDISLCGYPKKFIENAGTASSFEREHLPNNVCKSIGGSDKKAVYRECFATASKQFKEEYLLVGLTSKMKETECLLFYYTGEPWIPFPHTRDSSKVKLARQQKGPLQRGNAQKTLAECGGLGSLWPEDAHAAAVENMPRVAAIHDAASALLDERTAMARAEILARGQGVGAGHDLSLGAGCFGFSFAHPNENVTVT